MTITLQRQPSTSGGTNGTSPGDLPNNPTIRCAIYTRKSTEDGLEQEFNSLDNQREACQHFISSQRESGWVALTQTYEDGGFSGGSMDRPALKKLLMDIDLGLVDAVVVQRLDRFSRSLRDFTKLMEVFESKGVTFTSVTQQFNTATSMGRLTLNILLSFAQFEREITADRIREKFAAQKKRGKYCGGIPPLGYDLDSKEKKLVVNPEETKVVLTLVETYLETKSGLITAQTLNKLQFKTKAWTGRSGKIKSGKDWDRTSVYKILTNPIYIGKVNHKGDLYPGQHQAILSEDQWTAIQSHLKSKPVSRHTTRNREPLLLQGLLVCSNCQTPMGPTWTNKGNKQYRYYNCLGSSRNGWNTCPLKAVSAGLLEEAILDEAMNHSSFQESLLNLLPQDSSPHLPRQIWDSLSTQQRRLVLNRHIQKAFISPNGIRLELKQDKG